MKHFLKAFQQKECRIKCQHFSVKMIFVFGVLILNLVNCSDINFGSFSGSKYPIQYAFKRGFGQRSKFGYISSLPRRIKLALLYLIWLL